MNYKAFKQQVIHAISEQAGCQTNVSVQKIIKNNGIHLDGLIIQNECQNISPTIYLNYYYEDYRNGKSLDSIYTDILKLYHSSQSNQNFDLSFFTDYEKIKDRVVFKLVSHNQNQELLKDIPHFRYLDLAIVFNCLLLDTQQGNATILIHNHHLDFWHITSDILYDLAKSNTPKLLPPEIRSMADILNEFTDIPEAQLLTDKNSLAACPMYVLTNESKLHGASCLLYENVLDDFAEKQDCSLYVLPSSIHEALLLPAREVLSSDDLNDMIKEVNMTQVSDEEILSDHAYFFSKDTHLLSM